MPVGLIGHSRLPLGLNESASVFVHHTMRWIGIPFRVYLLLMPSILGVGSASPMTLTRVKQLLKINALINIIILYVVLCFLFIEYIFVSVDVPGPHSREPGTYQIASFQFTLTLPHAHRRASSVSGLGGRCSTWFHQPLGN